MSIKRQGGRCALQPQCYITMVNACCHGLVGRNLAVFPLKRTRINLRKLPGQYGDTYEAME